MKRSPVLTRVVPPLTLDRTAYIVALQLLQRFLTPYQGIRLADFVPLAHVEQVLDVACGPGDWVLDMAHTYRDINFFGIDRNPAMVSYARALATSSQREDVLFGVGDMHALAPVLNGSFDVVHTRFVKEATAMRQWPTLLKGLLRLCRPGGYVVLTEYDYPKTNSTAFKRWFSLLEEAVRVMDGTPTLPTCLAAIARNCRWHEVETRITTLNLSAGTEAHAFLYTHVEQLVQLVEPLLLHTKVCNKRDVTQLARDMLMDFQDEMFCAMWSLTTIVGMRPGVGSEQDMLPLPNPYAIVL